MAMLAQLPAHLMALVSEAEAALEAFDAVYWQASRGEGKWTHLELLGHLIDSAANNHQRFVRALAQPRLDWPGYDQMAHVTVQSYQTADVRVCLPLWASYNRLLAHVMAQITPMQAGKMCLIGPGPEMSLENLALDYVAHLEHHLKQMLGVTPVSYSGMPWPPAEASR